MSIQHSRDGNARWFSKFNNFPLETSAEVAGCGSLDGVCWDACCRRENERFSCKDLIFKENSNLQSEILEMFQRVAPKRYVQRRQSEFTLSCRIRNKLPRSINLDTCRVQSSILFFFIFKPHAPVFISPDDTNENCFFLVAVASASKTHGIFKREMKLIEALPHQFVSDDRSI